MTNAEVILRTVEWVEAHLKEELPVPAVARKAGYSLHHFIRLFGGVMGSSPGEYIARRKLSEAARELAAGKRSVTDIAFEYGFKDLETFTRAFKREMGTTPSAVRRGASFTFMEAARGPAPAAGHAGSLEKPVIERVDAFCLVGRSITVRGPTDEVGKLCITMAARAPTVPRACAPLTLNQLAWWLEDAEDCVEIMIGIRTTDLTEVPIDLMGKTVPACTCMIFTHHGSMARIGDAYRDIYAKWVPQSDRRPTLPFNFERYFAGQDDPFSEDYSMQICVPVE